VPFVPRALALLSIVAFATAAFMPCPPLERAAHERPAARETAPAPELAHPEGCEHAGSRLALVASCPCGCDQRAPVAGASARLGAALPSLAPALPAPRGEDRVVAPAARFASAFVAAIDHVPLPA
jgi:hypothetical protein